MPGTPWNSIPSSKWLQTLDAIIQRAQQVASRHNYQLVIERSGGSEARYLHILRKTTWFGIRIAAHVPVYPCSKDYFQVLLDDPPTDQSVHYAKLQISDLIGCNERVVANPLEVTAELDRQAYCDLSLRQVAAIRHRLNQRAKWVWEVEKSPPDKLPPSASLARH